jgi:PKD repeat protein
MKLKKIFCFFFIIYFTGNSINSKPKPSFGETKVESFDVSWKFLKYFLLPVTGWFPIWGKYDEGQLTDKRIPILNFDRSQNPNTVRLELINLLKLKNSTIKTLYSEIYNNAKQNPSSLEKKDLPLYSKHAAFVYWLGVKDNGDSLPESGTYSREWFYNNAVSVISGWKNSGLSYKGKVNQVWRAKENIFIMQAEDYLEASTLQSESLYNINDRKRNKESIKWITYELYSNANNLLSGISILEVGGALHMDNNMCLIVSAAIGMGAIVCHDEGAPFLAVQKQPKRWASSANAHINDLMWYNYGLFGKNNSLSERNDSLSPGFAEGPGYFGFTFINMLPYFQAFKNFTKGTETKFGPYHKSILNPVGHYINNYFADPDYLRLYDWYIDIQMPNGFPPTFDDTWTDNHKMAILAITGKKKHKTIFNITQKNVKSGYGPDFLLQLDTGITKIDLPELVNNTKSGNLVFRVNNDSLHKRHYLMFNVEEGTALNGGNPKRVFFFYPTSFSFKDLFNQPLSVQKAYVTWGHEHADLGNFIICGGEDQLIIDPPYFGDKIFDNFEVNQPQHHNMILADGEGPEADDGPAYSNARKVSNDYFVMEANYSYWNRFLGVKTDSKAGLEREIEILNHGQYPVYFINDVIENEEWIESFPVQYNLNGNGFLSDSTFELIQPNVAKWFHPCKKDSNSNDNYQVIATFSSFFEGTSTSNTLSITSNNNGNGNLVFNPQIIQSNTHLTGEGNIGRLLSSNSQQYGNHTTIYKEFDLTPGDKVNFKTTIEVLPCNSTPIGGLVRSNGKYNLHTIKPSQDIFDIHISRSNYSGNLDTTLNPRFDGNVSEKITTDGLSVLLSLSSSSSNFFGSCECFTNFRSARIRHGKKLAINDTNYIELSELGETYYKLSGKNLYKGYAQLDTITEIRFYLPDLEPGFQVKVDGFPFTYVDSTKTISIIFPIGLSEFLIEPNDPCLLSCYFPSTNQKIDETLDFNDGTFQVLGHKLDIIQPEGSLNISNGSKMLISCDKFLRNKDSLLLIGACDRDFEISSCDGPAQKFKSSQIPGIIVGSGSALVLDSGSFTKVGNATGIVVKSGGTLVIMDSATLEIGDDGCGEYGFVIAEPNSFVYIQPGAKIRFYSAIGDTVDRHQIIFSLVPSYSKTTSGVSSIILPLLVSDTILTSPLYPLPTDFCDLNNIMNPAIKNNDWGYANFMPPVANFKLRNDTLCPGEPLVIDLRRILNDNHFSFEICRVDSNFIPVQGGIGYWADTCIIDTMSIDSINPDPDCILPHVAPDWLIYYFKTSSTHRISFSINNDCNANLDTVFYVNVQDSPAASISIAPLACAGIGTVKMAISTDHIGNYSIDANLIDTAGGLPIYFRENQLKKITYHLDSSGAIPDTFDFPNFHFLGGRKYLLSLSLHNNCGSFRFEDTVSIPLGAYIQMERPTVYSNPVHGARQVQLHGFISEADSFRWSPDIWLNKTDTLVVVSTPEDSISYVLLAFSGNCLATDTAFIKYNRVANSGNDDTVCYTNSKILIGNGYDMSVFLGFLYFKGGNAFRTLFTNKTGTDYEYFRFLSSFMHSDYFKNWANNCSSLFTDFTEDLYREQTIKSPWFINYFEQLTAFDNANMQALDSFVYYVNNETMLQSNYNNTGDWGIYGGCMTDFFTTYDDFIANHLNEIGIAWIKVVENDTSFNGGLQESSIAIDEPTKTSLYIQHVITPYFSEFDETLVIVDTIPEVAFTIQFQMDSTVIFENLTSPLGSSSYNWDFGDGSPSSSEMHPIHTFSRFDTLFRVCLTANNSCGNYSWCDSIYIDSAHWGGFFFAVKEKKEEKPGNIKQEDGFQILFYPNPTNGNGVLFYKINQPFESGEILVFNPLGRNILEQEINKPSDHVRLRFDSDADGVYFYTITTNTGLRAIGKIIKHQ